ncbi:GyrI-like domain-containing protein [Methanoculleus chikugoensis]|uniref:GyrI-like domain-containing protein n=1 Tax=Methanoculleus chikugoensis TaxID=118126 RepID=UPI001FD465D0|nr:GyrI-like domain-containing protein [Methanoculleus chikugoensis]
MSIRTRAKVEDLPMLIGGGYGRMADYLKELGEHLSDVPYVAYHNMDMQNLDVEMGFPVPKVLPEKGDIRSGSIPEGKFVFCMYRGAYRDMAPTYEEMAGWIEKNGLQPVGTVYEHYYNGPEYPESELLTMIVMPVLQASNIPHPVLRRRPTPHPVAPGC